MTKVSVGGSKMFVEYDNSCGIVDLNLVENASHDNMNCITLSGGTTDPHFFYSIYLDAPIANPEQPVDNAELVELYHKVISILKNFHSTRTVNSSKAYIK